MKIPSEGTAVIANNIENVETVRKPDDFSEYMWMENEEEFDKEVMRQLEEEALMEQCIQAMLEDEKESAQVYQDVCNSLEKLEVQDKKDVVSKSTLNPNAAEFVPKNNLPSVG